MFGTKPDGLKGSHQSGATVGDFTSSAEALTVGEGIWTPVRASESTTIKQAKIRIREFIRTRP